MTNREMFLQEIEELVKKSCITLSEGANAYFESLKNMPEKEKAPFTENGAKVLEWMQNNYSSFNNILKAKEIAEGLFCSSRTVSGSIRKLITDGYVTKTGGNPVCYSLTESGMSVEVIFPAKKEETEEEDS